MTSSKRGLQLDRVVLLGRTLEEYCRYFALNPQQGKDRRILDVAAGVSSFTAEACRRGLDVTAVDPIYAMNAEEIAQRTGPDLDCVYRGIQGLETYRWSYYKNPEHMRKLREQAARQFLEDFHTGRGTRYLTGSLPDLPLPARSFDLTLVSYFLFAYEEQFSYAFHRDSIAELMRVTRGELRIYPLVTFEATRSSYLAKLKDEESFRDLQFEVVETDFEFLVNSNAFLRITRRP